jgi:hypothetical protein
VDSIPLFKLLDKIPRHIALKKKASARIRAVSIPLKQRPTLAEGV